MTKTFAELAFREASLKHSEAIRKIADRLSDVKPLYEERILLNLSKEAEVRSKLTTKNLKEKAGVYLFYTAPDSVAALKETLALYRLKQRRKEPLRRKALPRPNPTAEAKQGCLYVGKAKEGKLSARLLDHVFEPSRTTRALRLFRWATKMDPKPNIWLEVLVFEECDWDCIRDIEKALWTYFEPAIGEK